MRTNRRPTQRPALKEVYGEGIPGELRRRLGLWLKEQREGAGLTQRELAIQVGLEPGNGISSIENGRANIQPERYGAYAAALGMTRADFAKVILRHTDPWLYQAIYNSSEALLLEELAAMSQGSNEKANRDGMHQ